MKEFRSKLEKGEGVVVLNPTNGEIQRGKVDEVTNGQNMTSAVKVKFDKEQHPRDVDPANVLHDYGYLPTRWRRNGLSARLACAPV